VPIRDFVTDTKLVIDSSIRMIHAMVDMTAEKGHLNTVLNIILLLQMIIQGVWFTESSLFNGK
jgi:activating signal cointegrator complex subunit 3